MKQRKASLPRHLIAALAIASAVGSFAPDADACGGDWWPEVQVDHRIRGIDSAEKDLKSGKYQAAAGKVLRMIPHIRNYKKASKDPIVNRALRVLAVATARSEGKLNLKREIPRQLHATWLGKEAKAQQASLSWSVNALEALSTKKKDDPVLQGELGEAMVKVAGTRAKGQKLLEKLADKDLLTSPQAYAVLAKLRANKGDNSGEQAALKRCRAMAKDASICRETLSSTATS